MLIITSKGYELKKVYDKKLEESQLECENNFVDLRSCFLTTLGLNTIQDFVDFYSGTCGYKEKVVRELLQAMIEEGEIVDKEIT